MYIYSFESIDSK